MPLLLFQRGISVQCTNIGAQSKQINVHVPASVATHATGLGFASAEARRATVYLMFSLNTGNRVMVWKKISRRGQLPHHCHDMGSPDSEGRAVGGLRLPVPYGSSRWNTIFSFIHKTLEFSVKTNGIWVNFFSPGFSANSFVYERRLSIFSFFRSCSLGCEFCKIT